MIPIRCARIEWKMGGPFRVSHQRDDPADWSLKFSGGACFTRWQQMPASEEAALVAWLFHHAFTALEDGCDPKQVRQELEKVAAQFDFNRVLYEDDYLKGVRARAEVHV